MIQYLEAQSQHSNTLDELSNKRPSGCSPSLSSPSSTLSLASLFLDCGGSSSVGLCKTATKLRYWAQHLQRNWSEHKSESSPVLHRRTEIKSWNYTSLLHIQVILVCQCQTYSGIENSDIKEVSINEGNTQFTFTLLIFCVMSSRRRLYFSSAETLLSGCCRMCRISCKAIRGCGVLLFSSANRTPRRLFLLSWYRILISN